MHHVHLCWKRTWCQYSRVQLLRCSRYVLRSHNANILTLVKAWVMTVTEFATKEDRQRLGEGDSESVVKILSHVVQWAGALTLTRKEKHDKESTHGLYRAHLPETACIVRSKPVIETGLEDPGYLFAIGFSLPNTYARSGSISTPQGAKGQATAIRMRHLELMFGDMSGKTARQKIRCDAQANRGKYGHCAETNALSR